MSGLVGQRQGFEREVEELLAALRDHPDVSLDPAKGEPTRRLCAAYNSVYCTLFETPPPKLAALDSETKL